MLLDRHHQLTLLPQVAKKQKKRKVKGPAAQSAFAAQYDQPPPVAPAFLDGAFSMKGEDLDAVDGAGARCRASDSGAFCADCFFGGRLSVNYR